MSVDLERVYTDMNVRRRIVGGFLGPIFRNMATKEAFCHPFHDI
jgi:hypothetical protein